jgi:hypothetical protein
MPYFCPDCGYKSTKRIPSAQCPACDSYAIKSTGKRDDKAEQTPFQRNIRCVVVVILWAYLITEIYIKLYN